MDVLTMAWSNMMIMMMMMMLMITTTKMVMIMIFVIKMGKSPQNSISHGLYWALIE